MRRLDSKHKAEILKELVDGGSISSDTASQGMTPELEVTQIGTSVTNRLAMHKGVPFLYLELRIHNRTSSTVFLEEMLVKSSWGKYFDIPDFSSGHGPHETPLPIELLLNNAASEGIRLSAYQWIDGVLLARTAGSFPEFTLNSNKLEFILEVQSESLVTAYSFLVDNFISPAAIAGLTQRRMKTRPAGFDSISRQHDEL